MAWKTGGVVGVVACWLRACSHSLWRAPQIHFLLLVSRQGKIRLTKYYARYAPSEKSRMVREVATMVLNRSAKMCNFLEWKDKKVIYKRYVPPSVACWGVRRRCCSRLLTGCGERRYASLYFVACVDNEDNELITLEIIHHFVEVLDRYFGNVRLLCSDGAAPRRALLLAVVADRVGWRALGVRIGHHLQLP